MTHIRFVALSTEIARAYQRGEKDAYGQSPERQTSTGPGLPCRHCLSDVDVGEDYLILAHRPFSLIQPYAETGPIFLHAKACARHPDTPEAPQLFRQQEEMMVRGYDADERIVYGTGAIVSTNRIAEIATAMFDDPRVAFVDVRSAKNGCFQCRIQGRAANSGSVV